MKSRVMRLGSTRCGSATQNCICAIQYFFKKKNEDGTTDRMTQQCGFFNDMDHFKRCVDDGFFRGCSNFHFKVKEMNDYHWRMVKYMTHKGIKVTIE